MPFADFVICFYQEWFGWFFHLKAEAIKNFLYQFCTVSCPVVRRQRSVQSVDDGEDGGLHLVVQPAGGAQHRQVGPGWC